MPNLDQIIDNVLSAPPGPRILAVFDFDGTLISGYSPLLILREQHSQGSLGKAALGQIGLQILAHQSGLIEDHRLMEIGAELIKGQTPAEYQALCHTVYQKQLFRRIYPEIRQIIAAHRRRGHRLVIASSSPSQAITDIADELGIDTVLSSEYLTEHGRFTGKVAMPVCWGYGKRLAVEHFANKLGLNLDGAFFYSDSDDDLPLLEKVGMPVAINANSRLAEIAQHKGWLRCDFPGRKSGLGEVLRSLGLYGSLLGSYMAARLVSRLAGEEKEGQKFMVTNFSRAVCAVLGIKVELIDGHHLHNYRPRVVIFNHQSQADGLIVMKLLGEHFAAVGKNAFEKLKPLADAYSYAGIIPIDRSDGKSAIESMKPLVDAIKLEGRSVAIAPEGTRSTSLMPGPFKKGAFHLALDAGVEILPIVFYNSADVQAKGDFLFHPATVKVKVLAPISTADWKRDKLDFHIEQVRNMFIETLAASGEIAAQPPLAEKKAVSAEENVQ